MTTVLGALGGLSPATQGSGSSLAGGGEMGGDTVGLKLDLQEGQFKSLAFRIFPITSTQKCLNPSF